MHKDERMEVAIELTKAFIQNSNVFPKIGQYGSISFVTSEKNEHYSLSKLVEYFYKELKELDYIDE